MARWHGVAVRFVRGFDHFPRRRLVTGVQALLLAGGRVL